MSTPKKLVAKIFITGKIKAETGLHIGGSKSSLDIGGVDLNVIKTPKGEPFIPGSSLKGKLRSMLARMEGSEAINRSEGARLADVDFNYLNQLFGNSGTDNQQKDGDDKPKAKGMDKGEVSRLIVRDAALDSTHFKEEAFKKADLDDEYTTVKWENTIDRRKGTAEHPRQLERVPAGALFDFEIVYDLYEDGKNPYEYSPKEKEIYGEKPKNNQTNAEKHAWSLLVAMKLLESDYLGGQGSRGYGKVSFQEVKIEQKDINSELATYKKAEKVHDAFQNILSHFTQTA